jgi:RimJ/RimL family protein N-acetyltransferase
VASTAGALLVAWALPALGLTQVIARCDPANPASRIVAARTGAMVLP